MSLNVSDGVFSFKSDLNSAKPFFSFSLLHAVIPKSVFAGGVQPENMPSDFRNASVTFLRVCSLAVHRRHSGL